MRREILFNDGWIFHKGDIQVKTPVIKGPMYNQSKTERKLAGPAAYNYNDEPTGFNGDKMELKSEKWETAEIPHDFVVDQDLCPDFNCALGYLRYDNAWYRKHFTLEPEDSDKRITLIFDGIAGKSTVYLNGCLMYRNFSSYNTFQIDITDNVYFDRENIIAVYVDTGDFEGWWYQGGGIYRDVHMVITEKVAIDLWGVYAPYKKISETDWQIDFQTTVINRDFDDCDVLVESRLIDSAGDVVSTAMGKGRVQAFEEEVIKYSAEVRSPKLWDIDDPNLYNIETVLYKDGAEIDRYVTRTGFRTVDITVQNGLLLNGRKIFINGVCSHQDYGLTGLAVADNVARYKVSLMKQMGANGYRTSHYQQTASYMDAFDEMGFLVMDEVRWFESTKEGLEQLESLIKRDRNRPSVIMWSTGNEEPYHITENGRKIHRAMAEKIKKLDSTRFITAAQDRKPDESQIYEYCDLIGINYNLDLYDTVHSQFPHKPIFASECCACGTTRDWCFPGDHNGRIMDFDGDTNSWYRGREYTYKYLRERPYVFGCYQWAATEYRGEASWPRICSVSGALDIFLKKKGAFYQNKSHWTKEPMVHIVPHWNFEGLEGSEIFVPVYTNCQEVELFLNGESLGKKEIEKYGHGEWRVKYAPGTLEAIGYVKGVEAASDKKETTGRPERLRLTLDNDFEFNGRDVALFTCECLDENGRVVPDASETVTFTVNAPARILGTGSDNCDHTRVSSNKRKMYMGKITIAVKPAAGQKEITLLAVSQNCLMGRYCAK